MPAYVPTMSPRDRSMSICAVDGLEQLVDVRRRAPRARSGGRGSGWSVVPMIQWPGHGMMNTTRPGIRSVSPPCGGQAVAPDDDVRAAARDEACRRPRASANRASGSAAQTPVASMTRSARISNAVVAHEVARRVAPIEPLAVEQRRLGADPRRRDGAARERGPQHRERQPGVVLDPVVIDDPAGQALAAQVRRVLDRARRPEVLREPAVAPRAEQVVQEDAAAVEALVEQRDAVDREEERLEASRGAARGAAAARAPRAPRRRARSGAAPGSAGRRGSGATSGRTCPTRCRAARRAPRAARGSSRRAAPRRRRSRRRR